MSSTPSQTESTQKQESPWDKVFKSQIQQNKHLPKNWWNKHFMTIEAEKESYLEKLVNTLAQRDLEDPIGLWFTGAAGTGKTHLMLCLFNHICWQYYHIYGGLNGQVRYWSYTDLISTLREDPNNFKKFCEIREVAYLFIDDVGTTKGTDFVQEKIYSIFNYRMENELPTFVSTNLSAENIKSEFGERMSGRIKESCAWIDLKITKDRRTDIFKNNMKKYQHLTAIK